MASKSIRSFFVRSIASDCESNDRSTDCPSSSGTSTAQQESEQQPLSPRPPAAKRQKWEKRVFKDEWKMRYLMWSCKGSEDSEDSVEDSEMICIQCQERLKAKSSTATRHLERKHPASKCFSWGKKQRLIQQFQSMYATQMAMITTALKPDELLKAAPYKLAFVLAKHKMPFSSCDAFLEFARAADPNSSVLRRMAGSRDRVTRRIKEIHQAVLRPNIVKAVNNSPFWSIMADESTDSATMEQLVVYVRYINIQNGELCEDFLEMKRVIGHPDANNIFKCMMEVVDPEISNVKMPMHKLASFSTDGAAVTISAKQGVLGKLRSSVNPK